MRFQLLAWSVIVNVASPLAFTRRSFFDVVKGGAAGALVLSQPSVASAVVDGQEVSLSEAAAAGAVGLWIDLQGCSVCRHDVPAACSGTLIAPDLVLSARHCLDIPRELNGTLDRVVFSNNLLDPKAPSSKVLDVRVPADYGSQSKGFVRGDTDSLDSADLMLIKLASPAPRQWRPQRLAFGLEKSISGLMGGQKVEGRSGKATMGLTSLIGNPSLVVYGFGDSVDDETSYTSGVLHRLPLVASSAIGPTIDRFFAKPVAPLSESGSLNPPPLPGTCNGDSGSAALLGTGTGGAAPSTGPAQFGSTGVALGVVSATSVPCQGSTSALVNPVAFRKFLVEASAELGSPISITSDADWQRFLLKGTSQ